MEKLEVNNEVIRLQGILRTCRVYLIRKIVSNVRRLRTQRGSEIQRKKNAEKADRFLQQLQHIKKVDIAALAKEALISEASWAKVVADPKTTLERRTEARLLDHKSIHEFVGKFRQKKPSWKSWVPQIIEMWNQKELFQRNAAKSGDKKSEDSGEDSSDDISSTNSSKRSAPEIEEIHTLLTKKKLSQEAQQIKTKQLRKESVDPKVVERDDTSSQGHSLNVWQDGWKPVAKVDLKAQKVVVPFNRLEDKLHLASDGKKCDGSVESETPVLLKKRDSFFHDDITRGSFERGPGRAIYGFSPSIRRGGGRRGGSFNQQRGEEQDTEPQEDLHPSWLAKKQQNQSIAQFKGKKVVFH